MFNLAYDTSTSRLTAAIMQDSTILSEYISDRGMRHSRDLACVAKYIIGDAGLSVKDIDAVSLSVGPGSFTGLRIGISFAKGLAAALGAKVCGVSSLDVLALNVKNYQGQICCLVDAKKGKVYSARYVSDGRSVERVSEHSLSSPHDVLKDIKGECLFLGDGLKPYSEDIISDIKEGAVITGPDMWYPRAENVAALSSAKMALGEYDDFMTLVPAYLYPKECNVIRKDDR